MVYQEIKKLNEAKRDANAALYLARNKYRQEHIKWFNIAWLLVLLGFAWAVVDGVEAHRAITAINAEQQMQAVQHADDRIWYQTQCEPVSEKSGTITCVPNPELAK